jgi:hypothetical protein
MKKLFEVPYNFDEKLIKYYKKHADRINFLYLPPYKDDSINTRSTIQTKVKGHCYMPQSREEYERHLSLICHADLRFVVLWQDRNSIITSDQLDYYTQLGASGFIIANDVNSKIVKDYNPSLLVICSLVQRLQKNIRKRDFSNYDYIILYYTFNRSIDAIKELSALKDKIVLMPNTLCSIECPSVHHWFPSKDKPFDFQNDCWLRLDTLDKCGLIFPEHLVLFNQHVGGYKLQGREYPTEAIKYLCHFYFKEEYYSDFVSPFLREDMAENLKNKIHNRTPEEYYNTYTDTIIDYL